MKRHQHHGHGHHPHHPRPHRPHHHRPHRGPAPWRHAARIQELADAVGLTGDTRELFVRIQRETHAIKHALIRSAHGDRGAVFHHLEHLRDLNRARVAELLDDDQVATLERLVAEHRARRHARWEDARDEES